MEGRADVRDYDDEIVRVEPTGRRAFHGPHCGGCHGKGCPEVRLVEPWR